ncbi:MAG: DUF5063 domain-containing protein [Bacteroidales bacterium]|jgi:hypothetical protein
MKNPGPPVYSGHVVEFTAVAAEFCKYAEHASEFKGAELLNILQKLLPLLYLKASMLPELESYFEDGNEKFVTESDWNLIHDNLKVNFGSANDYIELLEDPSAGDEGTVLSGIAEDLADIYQDMKNFILLYQTGTDAVMNDAVWECRMNFENYWGIRLLNALKAIHRFLSSDKDIEDNNDKGPGTDDKDHSEWFLSKRQREFRNGDE